MARLASSVLVALIVSVALAGCGAPDDGATPPTTRAPVGEGGVYLTDEVGDAESHWDLHNVTVYNLNGSFVLRLVFGNITPGSPIPFYNVSIEADRFAGGTVRLWAALVVDLERHTGTRPVSGGFFSDGPRTWDPCHAINTGAPANVYHEMLNHRSDLLDGGVLTRLSVVVTNHTGAVQDEAEASGAFTLAGGPNPYPPEGSQQPDQYCPLLHDPSSPQKDSGHGG